MYKKILGLFVSLCTMALIFTVYPFAESFAGKGKQVAGFSVGDVVISAEGFRKAGVSPKKPFVLGTASKPILLGANMTNRADRVIVDFFAAHGSEIYISADKSEGIATMEDMDLCFRDDMICETEEFDSGGLPKAHLSCVNGEWSVKSVAGTCFRKGGCCYPSRDKFGCTSLSASGLLGQEKSHPKMEKTGKNCEGNFSPAEKNYCVVSLRDDVGSYMDNGIKYHGGVAGDTGDDMFRVQPGAEAVLIYKNAPANYQNILIEYSGGDRDLMIPAGPPGSYSDWVQFVDNPPSGVNIKRIHPDMRGRKPCRPVAFSLCGFGIGSTLPKPPVVDAECGFADDNPKFGGPAEQYSGFNGKGYASLNDIDKEGLCVFGDPVKPRSQNDPNYLRWKCAPPAIISGGAIDSCKTPRLKPRYVNVSRFDFGCDFDENDEDAKVTCAAFDSNEWDKACPTNTAVYSKSCIDEGDDGEYCNKARLECI